MKDHSNDKVISAEVRSVDVVPQGEDDPHHRYVLGNYMGWAEGDIPLARENTLQFLHKALNAKTGKFEVVAHGTTNEEVISVLIHRIERLNGKLPCIENAKALEHLHAALNYLDSRTTKRAAQWVEGTPVPHHTTGM